MSNTNTPDWRGGGVGLMALTLFLSLLGSIVQPHVGIKGFVSRQSRKHTFIYKKEGCRGHL